MTIVLFQDELFSYTQDLIICFGPAKKFFIILFLGDKGKRANLLNNLFLEQGDSYIMHFFFFFFAKKKGKVRAGRVETRPTRQLYIARNLFKRPPP